jgi:hypothetical protein
MSPRLSRLRHECRQLPEIAAFSAGSWQGW